MRSFYCKTHHIHTTESEQRGRPHRRHVVAAPNDHEWPTGCSLLRMATLQAVKPGETYHSGASGKSAYNFCEIEEV